MLPVWDKSYETGNALIDEQHRELLALVDQIETEDVEHMEAKGVLDVLDKVMAFTLSHFDMEEALMRQVQYPSHDQVEMINQHREFTDYARLRVMEFRASGPTDMGRFKTFLQGWLTQHEFGLDKKLATFIQIEERRAT